MNVQHAIRLSPAVARFLLLGVLISCGCVLIALQPRPHFLSAATSADNWSPVTLDDLRSDAAQLLSDADGVTRVEQLVSVPHPAYRIIHIADWHTVPRTVYAADLRDASADPLTDAEIEQAHAASDAITNIVQRSQRKLLRWMGTSGGVRSVFVEGVTDQSLPAYMMLVRAVGRHGLDGLPPDVGAAAQALVAGDIEQLRAAEDEAAHADAGEEAIGRHFFDGPANAAREAAIVKRLVRSGPLAVVVLGGDHDLSGHVRKIRDCDYLRVFVEGYPSDDTREGT